MAAFKFFSLVFKSLTAASRADLAFFCSVVRTFFLAPIPAAAETPAELAEAVVAGTATTPAINESAVAKATTNLVNRERWFISNPH
jgi:hypothetical protein